MLNTFSNGAAGSAIESIEVPLVAPSRVDSHGITFREITTGEQLAAMADSWNELVDDVPFLRTEWLAPWWRYYRRRGAELRALAAYNDDGQLVGLAPWYVQSSPIEGRVLHMLGSGDVCSDYVSITCREGYETAIVDKIASWLLNQRGRGWDALDLQGPDRHDPALVLLIARLADAGAIVFERPPSYSWRIPLPATWNEFVAKLSRTRRERVRQLCRRQFDTDRVTVEITQDAKELEAHFAILSELHQKRRAELGQKGWFASPRFAGFVRDAAHALLASGRLRLQLTRCEGRPIAIELDLLGADAVYFYQSGIEPAASNERPGWLGTIAGVRRAIAEGRRYFDFLRGDEPYKQHWRAEQRPLMNLRVAAPGKAARVHHCAWRGKYELKEYAKRRLRGEHRDAEAT